MQAIIIIIIKKKKKKLWQGWPSTRLPRFRDSELLLSFLFKSGFMDSVSLEFVTDFAQLG